MTPPWWVETAAGPPSEFLVAPPFDQRRVRLVEPADRAVVLGSTQPAADIDAVAAAAAHLTVLRRRSGGGAVLVGPGIVLWADVAIPAADPLWHPDVARAFWWLGDTWAAALEAAGLPGCQVWRGPLQRTPWSDRVCFAGVGAGEVTAGGAKVVGIAQRRTRAGAHFQCAVAIEWRPADLLGVMALDDECRAQGERDLAHAASGVGAAVARRLGPAFLERLP